MLAAFFILVRELEYFYNKGFGWICKSCERELTPTDGSDRSRLLREGEAEAKNPRLSTSALAKWTDEKRKELMCPRCGVMEKAQLS
jgi:hypothetical protein